MAHRRSVAILVVGLTSLALAGSALAASITIRVEGKTQTIFGALPVKADAGNAQQALEVASVLGEFHYGLAVSSFGTYVSQIGKYAGTGASGWVFKVNGVSPPVGADQVVLADGDEVLWYWATFTAEGGPRTLTLRADTRPNCYVVAARDDAGQATVPAATLLVDGRRVKTTAGKACVGKHRGLVKAFAVGAVRSNAVR